jgi:transcription elongation factor GreA
MIATRVAGAAYTADSLPARPRRRVRVAADTALSSILPVPDVHHLSQSTHDRLSAELETLTTHGRVDIARKIQAARELGDLSENGDYHAAKEEQGKMEGRIRHLQAILLDAEIVASGNTDSVAPGVIVSVCYEGDDEPEKFLFGSIEERDGDLEVVSPRSPLGAALAGRRIGDIVSFASPAGGELQVEIVDIEA